MHEIQLNIYAIKVSDSCIWMFDFESMMHNFFDVFLVISFEQSLIEWEIFFKAILLYPILKRMRTPIDTNSCNWHK